MKTSRWFPVVFLVAGWLLALVPCPVALAQSKDEIVIGAALPLSGSLAAHGRDLKWAYEQAASEVNEGGGIFVKDYGKKLKIKLVFADNGTNPMKAASMVEKLINVDKVDMLLGGAEPTCVLAACIAAERYKRLYHTAFGFPVRVWLEKKFKWSTNFFFSMDQIAIPFKILDSIEEQKRPKKLAIVVEDTFGGKGLAEGLRKTAEKFGKKIALEISLPVGSRDFLPQIEKLRGAGADSMLLYTNLEDIVTLVLQLKKTNYNIPYIHSWKGGWSGRFWKDLGKDAQYIICDGFWSMDYPYKGAKELGEKYYEAFGEYSVTVGLSCALANILFQAIEKAGSVDGAKVRGAILNNEFETVMGTVKYNGDGLALFPQVAAQWWDGKQMLVYPLELASWKVRLAPPWDKR